MTLLFSDPRFLKHDTGPMHPERPDRLRAIAGILQKSGLQQRCHAGVFAPLDPADLAYVHAPEVAARAQAAAALGAHLDADSPTCPDSFDVALAAAGACAAAVDDVLSEQDRNALCLVRPPGHHATPARSMGFCLFNNVALAAERARRVHGLDRILIVDWDVHHGNGTQDAFYADGGVAFVSIHRYGFGFYPGTGAADETGTGAGLGCITNVPVPYGTPRAAFLERFRDAVERAADRRKPQLVLVSAGFDAHRRDPIGSLGLESEDYRELTQIVLQVAQAHCGGRLVSCLEGGYDLVALAESTQAHLEELLDHAT